MKTIVCITIGLLLSYISIDKQKIPTIDITKSYSKKELVLQNIATINYIPLETSNNILIDKNRKIIVTSTEIIVYNIKQGDILLFNKQGKFIRKFNHKGQSEREYISLMNIITDDNRLFVISENNLPIYNNNGIYEGSLTIPPKISKPSIIHWNKNIFLGYKKPPFSPDYNPKWVKSELVFFDKSTGKTTANIPLTCRNGVDAVHRIKIGRSTINLSKLPSLKIFKKTNKGIVINEIACDTTFILTQNKTLKPLLIRTPKPLPTDKPLKMLKVDAIINDNIFFNVMLKQQKGKFPTTKYMWNSTVQQFFEYTLKNADVKDSEKLVSLEKYSLLPVDDLKELLAENKLTGKLKTLAEKLKEDDNPVLMTVNFKIKN